jgi:hypothetical protein
MKNKDSDMGLVFVGPFLIFLGLGMAYGRPDVGALIGLGVGFLFLFYFKVLYLGKQDKQTGKK